MSIERSTELLRLALPWMSRQAAGLHPVSYAVWFEYVARINAPLRTAIDEHLARVGTLDEVATHALFARHVADVDPETAQRVVDQMQRVLGGIGDAAGAAGAHAVRYSATLAQLAGALARGDTARGIDDDTGVARNGPPPRKLADVVAEVIADTGAMRSHLGALQQRLADSRREIDRLRDEVRRARDDALRDSLTGLANRRAFDQALAACLRTTTAPTPSASARVASAAIAAACTPPAAAGSATPAPAATALAARGCCMSDIDRFRRINDAYGRDFGDQVLQAVANALRTLVPAGATLARVDGEAFALLVPELDAAGALALAERVRAHIGGARIRRPGEGEAERVTLSVGVAGGASGRGRAQALLERAGRGAAPGQGRRTRPRGRCRLRRLTR